MPRKALHFPAVAENKGKRRHIRSRSSFEDRLIPDHAAGDAAFTAAEIQQFTVQGECLKGKVAQQLAVEPRHGDGAVLAPGETPASHFDVKFAVPIRQAHGTASFSKNPYIIIPQRTPQLEEIFFKFSVSVFSGRRPMMLQ